MSFWSKEQSKNEKLEGSRKEKRGEQGELTKIRREQGVRTPLTEA